MSTKIDTRVRVNFPESAPVSAPYFSIVIPSYNRARVIVRALDSCVSQDFDDFEIIVVDDGSTDGSPEIVKRHSDCRTRLICHEENRGVCPARNTGVDVAKGEWIIPLDSDDELLPGALSLIYKRTLDVAPDINRIVFMYRLDYGGISPDPPLAHETWDYVRYIEWVAKLRGTGDYCNVIRKCAFEKVRFPKNHAKETFFHLDFARHFLTKSCPETVALVHSDADDRSMKLSIQGLIQDAQDMAGAMEQLLNRHGEAVRHISPPLYWRYVQGASATHFLAGNRTLGLYYAARCLRRNPLSIRNWVVTGIGLLGRKPLAWLKASVVPALLPARGGKFPTAHVQNRNSVQCPD